MPGGVFSRYWVAIYILPRAGHVKVRQVHIPSSLFRLLIPCTFPVTLGRELGVFLADISLNRERIVILPKIQWINFSNACFLPVNYLINRELCPPHGRSKNRRPIKNAAPN